jgi:Protein of unknown function (DUF2489).
MLSYALVRALDLRQQQSSRCRAEYRHLIGSYLDAQVDRSECLLRIRVLLDERFPEWSQHLESQSLLTVSDHILAMPYGEARAKLDGETRRAQDGARRQLLQMHEPELARELTQLKEWITQ